MKPFFNLIVVMPIGPNCLPAFIIDTINSFTHYTTATYKIILADDSQKGTGLLIQKKFSEVDIVTTPTSMGKLCGLYITLSLAFRQALKQYHFDALLRMDTDALIIGKNPEQEAIRLFKSNPKIGIAGQYPLDYNGNPWDISWPKGQIIRYTTTRSFFKKPITHWQLLTLYHKALKNGYKTGESVFGGAYFMSEALLQQLKKAGLLPKYRLKTINLEEDHLFALLAKAVGFELGDLSGKGLPFGCAWKGLPAAPEELYGNGKKIIHSTRYWQDRKEEDIRQWFQQKRQLQPQNRLITGH